MQTRYVTPQTRYVTVSMPNEYDIRTMPVEEITAERLVQEEVWAQTIWPEGEFTLAEMIEAMPHLHGAVRSDGTLDLNAGERFLAALRDAMVKRGHHVGKQWALVYMWQGERHRHLTTGPLEVMEPILEEFKKDKWMAWLEEL